MLCMGRILLAVALALLVSASAFCPPRSLSSRSINHHGSFVSQKFAPTPRKQRRKSTSSLSMFMGSEGGILGVGAPEVFTILLVGYFVLGPSDLYKVVKEVGKLIQNFRTLSTDLTKTVETNLESQLEIEEIRKAQRELTDAFSFRRTINVDDETEAFSTKATEKSTDSSEGAAAEGEAAAATGAAVAVGKKKRIRRRVKKKVVPPVEETPPQVEEPVMSSNSGVVEDLDMTAAFNDDTEADSLREERMERLKQSSEDEQPWFNAPSEQEENRFAAQTSQSWNEKIMANEDKLSPLATVMERLAILEEEKIAADERLEEEFRLRTELEEKFYKEKRDMLEEAAAAVQAQAFAGMETTTEGNNNNSTTMQA